MSSVEETIPTTVANVKVVHLPQADGRVIEEALDALMTAVALGDQSRVLSALRAFVPEYVNPAEQRPAAGPEREVAARHRRVTA